MLFKKLQKSQSMCMWKETRPSTEHVFVWKTNKRKRETQDRQAGFPPVRPIKRPWYFPEFSLIPNQFSLKNPSFGKTRKLFNKVPTISTYKKKLVKCPIKYNGFRKKMKISVFGTVCKSVYLCTLAKTNISFDTKSDWKFPQVLEVTIFFPHFRDQGWKSLFYPDFPDWKKFTDFSLNSLIGGNPD